MDPVTFYIAFGIISAVVVIASCTAACTSIASFRKLEEKKASSDENTSDIKVKNKYIEENDKDGHHRVERNQEIDINNYHAGAMTSNTKLIKNAEENHVANQIAQTGTNVAGILPFVGNPVMTYVGPANAALNTVTDNVIKARQELKKDKKKKEKKKPTDDDSDDSGVYSLEEYPEEKKEKKHHHKKPKPKKEDLEVVVTELDEEHPTKPNKKEKKSTTETPLISLDQNNTELTQINITGDNSEETSSEN